MTLNFEHHGKFDSIFYSWYYKNIIYPPEKPPFREKYLKLKTFNKKYVRLQIISSF